MTEESTNMIRSVDRTRRTFGETDSLGVEGYPCYQELLETDKGEKGEGRTKV